MYFIRGRIMSETEQSEFISTETNFLAYVQSSKATRNLSKFDDRQG